MIEDALDALARLATPPFRGALIKSVALTLALLVACGVALHWLVGGYIPVETGWLAASLSWLLGLGLLVALAFMVAPVTSLVAGFFVDEIAGVVERDIDPSGPPGRSPPLRDVALFSLRFAGLSILVNLVALALLLAPGINAVAFLGANAYLLGREYFELAAMRFRSLAEARAMRRYYSGRVFFAGLIIALFVSIPLLNLAAPLFATALMTRLHKRLSEAPRG